MWVLGLFGVFMNLVLVVPFIVLYVNLIGQQKSKRGGSSFEDLGNFVEIRDSHAIKAHAKPTETIQGMSKQEEVQLVRSCRTSDESAHAEAP